MMTSFAEIKQLFSLSATNGYTPAEMQNCLENFGKLPEVLYDYYTQLGKVEHLNNTQDQLLDPDKMRFSPNGDFVIFYAENQWACVWAIRKEELEAIDPPVYMSFDEEKWSVETDRTSLFLVAMANLQATFGLPYSSEEFSSITTAELEIIQTHFKKKTAAFSKWIGIDFYGNHENDVVAVMKNEGYFDMMYASGNKLQFDELYKKLNLLGHKIYRKFIQTIGRRCVWVG